MITGKQIRAARMLLEWDAEDLAAKAGVTRETIFNIERSVFRPRPATLEKIINAFDAGGVVFNGDRGVELRDDTVQKIEGDGYYLRFLDQVHSYMRGKKGSVLFLNTDDSLSSADVVRANKQMMEDGIKCLYLCKENPTKLSFPPEYYRAVPEKYYRNGLLVVYDDFLAASVRGKMIVVFKNAEVASSVRKLFELIWSIGRMPEVPNATTK